MTPFDLRDVVTAFNGLAPNALYGHAHLNAIRSRPANDRTPVCMYEAEGEHCAAGAVILTLALDVAPTLTGKYNKTGLAHLFCEWPELADRFTPDARALLVHLQRVHDHFVQHVQKGTSTVAVVAAKPLPAVPGGLKSHKNLGAALRDYLANALTLYLGSQP